MLESSLPRGLDDCRWGCFAAWSLSEFTSRSDAFPLKHASQGLLGFGECNYGFLGKDTGVITMVATKLNHGSGSRNSTAETWFAATQAVHLSRQSLGKKELRLANKA